MELGYILNLDLDQTLTSDNSVSYVIGSIYSFNEDIELSSDITIFNAPSAYIQTDFLSSFTGTKNQTIAYIQLFDTGSFLSSNLTGLKNQTIAYIQLFDTGSFLSSNLTGLKNTQALPVYIQLFDTGSFLSSNLTGLKNTQALPVYIQFSSAIPFVRLNVSDTAPFLKQVFVE